MTSTRHGPLWGSTDGAATGWVRMTCDCGWNGTVQPSTLYAIEEYGDHRAQVEMGTEQPMNPKGTSDGPA